MVKIFLPSSWNSSYNPMNFRTSTFLFNTVFDPNLNPLLMKEELSQLVDSFCSCRSGLRTCSSCSHRTATMFLLCGTEMIDTAKVPEAVVVDTARYLNMYLHIYQY